MGTRQFRPTLSQVPKAYVIGQRQNRISIQNLKIILSIHLSLLSMIIYKITNLFNERCYIGATLGRPKWRWKAHRNARSELGRDIRKYGRSNFQFRAVAIASSIEELKQLEISYILQYNTLYPSGYNRMIGGRIAANSNETKKAMSIGKENRKLTKEQVQEIYRRFGGRKHWHSKSHIGIKKAAIEFGVSATTISGIAGGRTHIYDRKIWNIEEV